MIDKKEEAYISNLMIDAFEDYLLYMRNVDFSTYGKDVGVTIKQMHCLELMPVS